ncbi:AI-2E family transporter [Candidatus Deianiraea vastatrix]|uniref:AI-2E family transporter n=1 Tax=Candidatus Deianiraea vastatrix TaxID=2163644 RepID=A0A5B8XFC2_9RICK|nr:AI-2E family transporter [Candidatus Deianiraea vastatrix]QED23625.1 Putative AI-2E family transporter [Candidatus Deianiraea vastatrix]
MTKISKKYIFWAVIAILFTLFYILAENAVRPFAVSFIVSYLLLPIVNKFEKMKFNRSIVSGVIVSILFFSIIFASSILIPFLYEKVISFLNEFVITSDNLSQQKIHKLSNMLHIDDDTVVKCKAYLQTAITKFQEDILHTYPKKTVNSIINIVATIVVMPIITFYMLKDWRKMVTSFYIMLPHSARGNCRLLMHQIDTSIFAYLRGQLNVCLFFMIFYSILLHFSGLNLGFLLGIMTGVMIFIPYVGFLIGIVICLVVAFLQFGFNTNFVIISLIFTAGQIIDANYTTPKFVGDKVGIHPVIIVFGLFVATSLFGVIGAILALPITTTSTILFKFLLQKYKTSHYYA